MSLQEAVCSVCVLVVAGFLFMGKRILWLKNMDKA